MLHFKQVEGEEKFLLILKEDVSMYYPKNLKTVNVAADTLYKKSNKISMAQISKGLTLQQTQIIAYAIHKTQQDGTSSFQKKDIERQLGKKMTTQGLKRDTAALMDLKFSLTLADPKVFGFLNFFQRISYDHGKVSFKWSDDMVPHIIDLKEKYITNDLRITSKFISSFSWTLYEYLKANYGKWHTEITKEEALKLFGVSSVKTYNERTSSFKQKVLDTAVEEVNKHTEYNVYYEDIRNGRAISAFRFVWSVGEAVKRPTAKQIQESERRLDHIIELSSQIVMEAMTELSMEDIIKVRQSRQKAEEIHERINAEDTEYDDVSQILSRYLIPMHELLMMAEKIKLAPKRDREKYDWISGETPLYNWLEE